MEQPGRAASCKQEGCLQHTYIHNFSQATKSQHCFQANTSWVPLPSTIFLSIIRTTAEQSSAYIGCAVSFSLFCERDAEVKSAVTAGLAEAQTEPWHSCLLQKLHVSSYTNTDHQQGSEGAPVMLYPWTRPKSICGAGYTRPAG